jgi:hypothetical protein
MISLFLLINPKTTRTAKRMPMGVIWEMIKGILKRKKAKAFENGSPASMKLSIFSIKSRKTYMPMTSVSTMPKILKISRIKYL